MKGEQPMKEQIEEMWNDIGEKQEGGWVFVDNSEYTTDVFNEELAEHLVVNKGYRKQKEGEWKYNEDCDCFVCSVCGNSALNNYRGLSVNSNFCPNCGAHMKGGAE